MAPAGPSKRKREEPRPHDHTFLRNTHEPMKSIISSACVGNHTLQPKPLPADESHLRPTSSVTAPCLWSLPPPLVCSHLLCLSTPEQPGNCEPCRGSAPSPSAGCHGGSLQPCGPHAARDSRLQTHVRMVLLYVGLQLAEQLRPLVASPVRLTRVPLPSRAHSRTHAPSHPESLTTFTSVMV